MLCADENYVAAAEIKPGAVLYGGNTVTKVELVKLEEKINVYDMTVPKYYNFLWQTVLSFITAVNLSAQSVRLQTVFSYA